MYIYGNSSMSPLIPEDTRANWWAPLSPSSGTVSTDWEQGK